MLYELKATFRRSAPTLAQDMAGVAALVVLLLGALHLPLVF
ncbi:hypothetical protein [Alkalilacustris brevis]|nr:hypothetical protein [Alkalilacustris brevis]